MQGFVKMVHQGKHQLRLHKKWYWSHNLLTSSIV